MSSIIKITGAQGKVRLEKYSDGNIVGGTLLDYVVLDNALSDIIISKIIDPEENFRGDNIENFKGYKYESSTELLNIFNADRTNIIKFFNIIQSVNESNGLYKMRFFPLYDSSILTYNNFSVFVLQAGGFKPEYLVKFLNTAQKFEVKFVHKFKLLQLPLNLMEDNPVGTLINNGTVNS